MFACEKDLDVLWKVYGTVAILIRGNLDAEFYLSCYYEMSSIVSDAHGVEFIESLRNHESLDVRTRARFILQRIFGGEASNFKPFAGSAADTGVVSTSAMSTSNASSITTPLSSIYSLSAVPSTTALAAAAAATSPHTMGHCACSCAFNHNH